MLRRRRRAVLRRPSTFGRRHRAAIRAATTSRQRRLNCCDSDSNCSGDVCDDAGDAATTPSCFEPVLRQSSTSNERVLRRHRRCCEAAGAATTGGVAASRCCRRRHAASQWCDATAVQRVDAERPPELIRRVALLPALPCRPPELLGVMVMAVLCDGKNRGREDCVDFHRRLGTPRSYGSGGCCFLFASA